LRENTPIDRSDARLVRGERGADLARRDPGEVMVVAWRWA
jgi:hypothetical protein